MKRADEFEILHLRHEIALASKPSRRESNLKSLRFAGKSTSTAEKPRASGSPPSSPQNSSPNFRPTCYSFLVEHLTSLLFFVINLYVFSVHFLCLIYYRFEEPSLAEGYLSLSEFPLICFNDGLVVSDLDDHCFNKNFVLVALRLWGSSCVAADSATINQLHSHFLYKLPQWQ